jgi:DNA-binding IclR family transcriptional regulator
MAGNSSTPGQSVTAKLFFILEAFRGERTALTMSEISRSAGLSTSTTHRLIHDAVAAGALERLPDGSYTIGIRLWEIAARSNQTYGLREVAMPFLQSLWETTKAHVLLSIIEGTEALLIERITGTRNVPAAGRAGGRLPLHASSSGLILLAHASPGVLQAVLSQPLAAYMPKTVTSPEILIKELERIRRDGFAISEEGISPGAISFAAPVFDAREGVCASVSILSSSGTRDAREMKLLVQMAARGITHALAHNSAQQTISPRLRKQASR